MKVIKERSKDKCKKGSVNLRKEVLEHLEKECNKCDDTEVI